MHYMLEPIESTLWVMLYHDCMVTINSYIVSVVKFCKLHLEFVIASKLGNALEPYMSQKSLSMVFSLLFAEILAIKFDMILFDTVG